MTFFGKRVPNGKIVIDRNASSAASPEARRRMQRISDNYVQLDTVLSDLEVKIGNDPTLREFDEQLTDAACTPQTNGKKKRRTYKRRTVKSSSAKPRSANPKKPR